MKNSILSLMAVLVCGTLFAQEDKQNAIVSVENDYNPVVVQVNKKSFTPTIESKSNAKPSELVFSKQATPFSGFTSERDFKETLPSQEKSLPGYLRLGYGFKHDSDAKLAYNLRFSEKSIMRALASFDGFKCDINGLYGNEWNSRMFNTAIIADYTYKFKKLHFNIAGEFNNRVFNYQRTGSDIAPTDRQHHMNYSAGISGVSQLAGPFSYTFKAGYTHSLMTYSNGMKNPIAENHVNAGTTMAYEIYSKSLRRTGVELDFNGYIYNNTLLGATNKYRNLMSIDFNPFADFNFNGWKILVGVNLNFMTANGPVVAAAPNFEVEKNFTKRISYYAKLKGGRKDNSFAIIESITPYWGYNSNTDRQTKPTYRIVDLTTGAKMTIEPFSFDIFAGYALTKDDLLQQVSYSAPIPTALIYTNFAQSYTHDVHAGCRMGLDCGGWLNIEADARYDFWSCADRDLLGFKPEITANANIEVYPIKNLTIKTGYNFTRYTKTATQGRLNCKHDLHARISYKINKMFGAFIQGDNLLNNKYYDYAGYLNRGIRGMLGATMNF